MKTIPLTKGAAAIVDDDTYEYLNQWKWTFDMGYAKRNTKAGDPEFNPKKRAKVSMASVIMNCPKGKVVDHINRNRLDNRKCNLRICSPLENSRNKPKRKAGYHGVYLDPRSNRFQVIITVNNKTRNFGTFKEERHAAMAYDIWAKDVFGAFAEMNFTN